MCYILLIVPIFIILLCILIILGVSSIVVLTLLFIYPQIILLLLTITVILWLVSLMARQNCLEETCFDEKPTNIDERQPYNSSVSLSSDLEEDC